MDMDSFIVAITLIKSTSRYC